MNKISHTYFFGYLSMRYRRLLRSLIILTAISGGLFSLTNIYNDTYFKTNDIINTIYEKYDKKEFSQQNIYTTPNGNERTEIYLRKRYGDERFTSLVYEGLLKKNNELLNKVLPNTKAEFIELLKSEKSLRYIAFCIAEQENYTSNDIYNRPDDYIITLLNLREEHSQKLLANKIIPLLLINLGFYFLIGFISYVLEPFVIEKRNRVLLTGQSNNETIYQYKDNLAINKSENTENELNNSKYTNNEHNNKSKFANYFSFNDEYLSGTQFWIRMFVGWITIVIFGLGYYFMLTATYKRAQSLGFNTAISIIACIYIPIMNIFTFVILRTDYSEVNLWKSILLSIPFVYFYLKNGTRKQAL